MRATRIVMGMPITIEIAGWCEPTPINRAFGYLAAVTTRIELGTAPVKGNLGKGDAKVGPGRCGDVRDRESHRRLHHRLISQFGTLISLDAHGKRGPLAGFVLARERMTSAWRSNGASIIRPSISVTPPASMASAT